MMAVVLVQTPSFRMMKRIMMMRQMMGMIRTTKKMLMTRKRLRRKILRMTSQQQPKSKNPLMMTRLVQPSRKKNPNPKMTMSLPSKPSKSRTSTRS